MMNNVIATVVVLAATAILTLVWKAVVGLMRGNRVFLSIPMAAVDTDDERAAIKSRIDLLIQTLEHRHGLDIYCAYTGVSGAFDPGRKAFIECFREIRKCRYFVAILPSLMATSAYVETGYALAMKKDVLIMHASGALPYLLREIESAGFSLLGSRVSAKRLEVADFDAAVERLKISGLEDFPGWAKSLRFSQKG
ncbi:MAG: hypothetical protein KKA37_06660 [Alphaproteobacteria bacterium]|nr:hypothetical protein [Alphaproteobacteria bacterium]